MSDSQQKDRRRVEAYQKELAADPSSLVFVSLAEAHNRLGEWELAAKVAQRGLEAHHDSVAGRLALAVAEAGKNNVKAALEQIKAALLVDEQNPRALALMGSLLLQKGLSNRALDFLTQAAKLAPESREYADLLKRARRLAKNESPVELPVLKGESIAEADNPWAGGGESSDGMLARASQHTVFDPDAFRKQEMQKRPAPEALPLESMEGKDGSVEPTQFATQLATPSANQTAVKAERQKQELPAPRRVPGPGPVTGVPDGSDDSHDDQTTYDVRNVVYSSDSSDAGTAKPKLGGSAAEYGRGGPSSTPPGPPPSDFSRDELTERPTVDIPRPELPKGPSESTDEPTAAPPKADAGQIAQALSDAVRPSKERVRTPPLEAPPAVSPAALEPKLGEERPATVMVDDAVWAMFVGDKPGQKGAKAKPLEPKPSKEKLPASDEEEGPRAGRVVRTAESFGRISWWAVVLVIALAAAWTGYSAAMARSTKVTVDAREELLRGIASDLERGGLAALLRADEALESLIPSAPDLAAVLRGVKAEVNARIWADFGRDPKSLEVAQSELAAVDPKQSSLEGLAARVVLSTRAEGRSALFAELSRSLLELPDSPKAWTLKAELLEKEQRSEEALRALYQAHDLHTKRRRTLLMLARWHARNGSFAAAFNAYDELHERSEDDVEAALERYVLGLITGRDPNANEAASTLAGLVRVEMPEVAKDEAGRVALAFAVRGFARGDLELGLEQLHKAEAAFDRSADFKAALGGLFLAVGEWDRARAQYQRALELAPSNRSLRLGLARAEFAEKAGLSEGPSSARLGKPTRDLGNKPIIEVSLPHGSTHFVLGAFQLVETRINPMLFPESAYAEAMAKPSAVEFERALEAASSIAQAERLRRQGKLDEALQELEKARAAMDLAAVEIEIGRLRVLKKDLEGAEKAFLKGLRSDPNNLAGLLGLAQAQAGRKKEVEALDALDRLGKAAAEAGQPEPVAALRLGARLRMKRGDSRGALELLERVLKTSPSDVQALLDQGELQHRLQHPEEALKSYRRAIEASAGAIMIPGQLSKNGESPSGIDLYYLGRLILEKNEDRGVVLLAQSLRLDETPIEARFYLGRAWLKHPKTKKLGKKELETFRRAAPEGELSAQAERLLKAR